MSVEPRNPKSRPVVPDEKYYSTGEVMEHTKLSRQTLHNYKRLGLIVPVKWTDSGHCYYDESVFVRLRKIKLFQRYHSLQAIRRLLDADEPMPAEAGESSSDASASEEPLAAAPAEDNRPALAAPDPNTPDAARWSDNKDEASNLARNLLRAQRFPEKLYRIGDLIRLTGYSRQTLHNYTIQGLLRTRERTASGHRLYGADSFTVLRLIEVFKRHRRFDEVQALIEQWRKYGRPLPGSGQMDSSDSNPIGPSA